MPIVKFPDGSEIEYILTRKPVKNINLRIKEDGAVSISANSRVSTDRIERFIISEQSFILKAQQRIRERNEKSRCTADSVRWLGKEYPVRVLPDSREAAVLEQEEMRVFTLDSHNDNIEQLINVWLIDNFMQLCRELNAQVRHSLTECGLKPPPTVITIKDMKTRWGSCTWTKGHISINFRLYAYPRDTVLSVFWHEYAHYWHHDHSAAFYDFLEKHYPEYRSWNSLLK